MIDGVFYPGRTCNSLFGTRSAEKLIKRFPHKSIQPHFDKGKHCYWFPINRDGEKKAQRLGLIHIDWRSIETKDICGST